MSVHTMVIAVLVAKGVTQDVILAVSEALDKEIEAQAEKKRMRNNEHKRNSRLRKENERRGRHADYDLFERSTDDETRYADAAITADDANCQFGQQCQTDKRNPHKENTSSSLRSSEEVSGVGESRAREPEPLVSEQARDMADAIAIEAGFDLKFIPPGWCGAANHLQDLLTQGYSENQIRIAVTTTLRQYGQKGRGPPLNFAYFRKAVPNVCADMRQPIPKFEPRSLEVIDGGKSNAGTGTYRGSGRSRNLGSATDAFAELREYFTRGAEEDEQAAPRLDQRAGRKDDGGLSKG